MATIHGRELVKNAGNALSRFFSLKAVISKDIRALQTSSKKTGIAKSAKDFISTVPLEEITASLKDPDSVSFLQKLNTNHLLVASEVNTRVIYGIVNADKERSVKELVNYEPASVRTALN